MSRPARFRHPTACPATARAAGWDAGIRSMEAAGRTAWGPEDWNAAAATVARLVGTPA